jgi:hypothetical protein
MPFRHSPNSAVARSERRHVDPCTKTCSEPSEACTTLATAHADTPVPTVLTEAIPAVRYEPLYCLALGAFAVGTEGFMIAAILPSIAGNLAVSFQMAGQLVTVFTLVYAVSS